MKYFVLTISLFCLFSCTDEEAECEQKKAEIEAYWAEIIPNATNSHQLEAYYRDRERQLTEACD